MDVVPETERAGCFFRVEGVNSGKFSLLSVLNLNLISRDQDHGLKPRRSHLDHGQKQHNK
jgi:hypothetical protein